MGRSINVFETIDDMGPMGSGGLSLRKEERSIRVYMRCRINVGYEGVIQAMAI